MEFADENYYDNELPIDILIGADFYWNLVNNEIVCGDKGPVSLSSKLGYLLGDEINHASTRGLFLDPVPDASSTTCVVSLRHVTSHQRGAPKLINSDNGTQFTAEETQNFASQRNIRWKFNLATAPW